MRDTGTRPCDLTPQQAAEELTWKRASHTTGLLRDKPIIENEK
jgi:hypothetical protein